MEYQSNISIRIYTNLDDLCKHNKDTDVHSGFTQQFVYDLEEFLDKYQEDKGIPFDPPVYVEVG